jgi:hypothetical protein
MQKIRLDCDACGAPLEIDRPGLYKCSHCGRTYLVGGQAAPETLPPAPRQKPTRKTPQPTPISPTPNTPQAGEDLTIQIKALLAKGLKIQAVKLYKDATGLGLRESKDFVDAIEKNIGAR